jgi:hypothetical protein
MKVKAKYTFKVNLGFGNVYEFFEGKITEIKDLDAGHLFEKYPGMLEVVSEKEEKTEETPETANVAESEVVNDETKPKGQKNKTKK